MSGFRVKILILIMAVLSVLGLMRCGGGGSSSESPTASPATLTDNNVDAALAEIATYVQACVPADSVSSAFRSSQVVPGSVPKAAKIIVQQNRSLRARVSSKVLASETTTIDPIAGSCGGTLSGSITTDNVANTLSGSIAFNDFCQDDGAGGEARVNGNLSFSGRVSDTAITLNASSSSLQLTSLGESFHGSFNVSLTMDLNDGTSSITLRSFSGTKNGGKTISGRNVVISVSPDTDPGNPDGSIIDFSGTITDSVHGSMVIDTVDPLISDGFGALISGSGTITGANGTEVKVTISGPNLFQVGLDSDGDHLYDDYTQTMDCSALDVSNLFGIIGF